MGQKRTTWPSFPHLWHTVPGRSPRAKRGAPPPPVVWVLLVVVVELGRGVWRFGGGRIFRVGCVGGMGGGRGVQSLVVTLLLRFTLPIKDHIITHTHTRHTRSSSHSSPRRRRRHLLLLPSLSSKTNRSTNRLPSCPLFSSSHRRLGPLLAPHRGQPAACSPFGSSQSRRCYVVCVKIWGGGVGVLRGQHVVVT
jgi:hypothetical protein